MRRSAGDRRGPLQRGWFYPPTVLEGLPNECRTNQEEIFGPVVSLIPFDDDEEAFAWPTMCSTVCPRRFGPATSPRPPRRRPGAGRRRLGKLLARP